MSHVQEQPSHMSLIIARDTVSLRTRVRVPEDAHGQITASARGNATKGRVTAAKATVR